MTREMAWRGRRQEQATDDNVVRMPTRKVVRKSDTSGSGGAFLKGLAAILVTIFLTVGGIVGYSVWQANQRKAQEQQEQQDQRPDDSKQQTQTQAGVPLAHVDANGVSTGTATAGDVSADNPTQSFFASRGTLSDTAELGYLGERLNEEERRIYLQIHAAIASSREDVDVTEVYNEGAIDIAWQCLFDDHPEFFWMSGDYTYRFDPMAHTAHLQFGIAIPLSERNANTQIIENKAIEFQNSIPAEASQYDIAMKAYEFIIRNCEYDESAQFNQTILSVFASGRSVCAGYARAYQYLLHRSGQFCSFVHGKARTEDGNVESHAWNLICVDGTYAFVDPTWGDRVPQMQQGQPDWGEIRYAYFGMPTGECLMTGHEFDHPEWWPQCDSYDLSVYRRSGMLFDAYDRMWFQGLVREKIGLGWTSMELQFTNPESFRAALDDTSGEECLADLADWMDVTRASYTVMSNETTRTMRLSWQKD